MNTIERLNSLTEEQREQIHEILDLITHGELLTICREHECSKADFRKMADALDAYQKCEDPQ